MMNKKLVATTVFLLVIIATVAVPTTTAYAQFMSPQAEQIFDDATAYCERIIPEAIPGSCLTLPHQSPTTVVLSGDLSITRTEGRAPIGNVFIWQAVDGFKALGYTIDSVLVADQGRGADDSPDFMVVMSKQ